ncbi:helix-turn-helix domain-containing protein [Bacillus cereus]|uniref:helix-turn-helix domain-containing protein n=1 Tax=Bacillus cereus TaxID=1396 RepID=UPI002D787B6B|nr:helix-turn-helix domain-containing protein [Bacillus cereus]
MAKLRVTTKYGVTVHDLLQEERKTKNSFFKQRLQSVFTYVKTFNSDGIEGLLERRYPPGRTPYLSPSEESEI